jgi:hypothetical protein
MITLLEKTEGKVIGLEISGEVTNEDVKKIKPMITDTIAKHNKINLLLILEDFRYTSLTSFFDDVSFIGDNLKNTDRISIVGNNTIQEIFAKASSLAIKNLKYFNKDQLKDAWGWVEAN